MKFIEKRTFERIPARLEVITPYGNLFHSGTIMNLSEGGMFIRTKKIFPFDTKINIHIENEQVRLFSRVRRFEASSNYSWGIGLEIVNAQLNFIEFVLRLRAVWQ